MQYGLGKVSLATNTFEMEVSSNAIWMGRMRLTSDNKLVGCFIPTDYSLFLLDLAN